MLTPEPIIQLATGYWQSRTFLAANQLNFFDALGSDGQPLSELSMITKVSEERLRPLVGALKEMKLIRVCELTGDILPTELTSIFLNPESPAYMGDSLSYARDMFPLWHQLEERLQDTSPKPLTPSKKDTPSFLASMHERANMIIPLVLPLLNFYKDDSLFDVAAGAGTWSFVIQNHLGLQDITLLEQPELLSDMQSFISDKGLQAKEYIAADYHTYTTDSQYHHVLYFGALHQENNEQANALLEKFFSWVKPGGSLVILDIFSAEQDTENLFAYLFGLNMSLTTAGSVHHLQDTEATLNALEGVGEVVSHRLKGSMPYYLIEVKKN